MTEMSPFIYGAINFVLFVALFVMIARPLARHFFFERRARIRKRMIQSIWELRTARERLGECRRKLDLLPKDIEERRAAIEAICDHECKVILSEAREREGHLMKGATRHAEDERNQSATLVRSRLLAEAFRRAELKLGEQLTKEDASRLLDRGLEKLGALSTSDVTLQG